MSGEAPVGIEALLAHRGWVRALAGVLVADEAQADDLAQQVWLETIEHPPAHGGALRAWFARIVRRRARDAWRERERRGPREAASAVRGNAASAASVVVEAEAHRRVVEAVMALDEPFRATVLLRFFEDLPPREVAARMGVPVETVRSRLKRALARMRTRLDEDHGGDRRAWCAVLFPVGAAGAAPAEAALVQGGIAVTTKAKVSLAALVLLALTVSVAVLAKGGGTPAPATRESGGETAGAADPQRRVKTPDATKPRDVDTAPLPHGGGAIVGAVRFASDGRPAPRQRVVLDTYGSAPVDVLTDERGSFRFDRLAEVRAWRVGVAADGFASVVVPNIRLDRDESRDLGVIRLEAPARIDVVVRDWNDHPISGATVEIHPEHPAGIMFDAWTIAAPFRGSADPVAAGITDDNGRAAFASLPSGRWFVVARAAGFATGTWYGATAKNETTLRLDRGVSLAGRVVERDGRPVPGATVWASVGDRSMGPRTFPRATTTADGRFLLEAVPPGDVSLLVGRGGSVPAESVTVRVPAGAPVELVLDGNVIEGRVTSASDATPIAGAHVLADVLAKTGNWVVEATTGEDGTYRLDTLRAGDVWRFHVERHGFVAICENGRLPEGSLVIEGGHATRDFVLGRGVSVSGLVTGPAGPIVGARVAANWIESRSLLKVEAFSDTDGKFEIPHVPTTTVLVQAWAPSLVQDGLPVHAAMSFWAGQKPTRWLFEVPAAGLRDVEIVMRPEEPRSTAAASPAEPVTVRVSGRVTSASGVAPEGASVVILFPPEGNSQRDVETMGARAPVKDDGQFEARIVPRGPSFRVRATAPGFAAPDSPPLTFAPDRTSFEVDAVLAPLLVLEGRIVSSEDATKPAARARLALRPAAWKFEQMDRRPTPVAAVTDADGRFRIDGVASGDAQLDVTCDGFVHEVIAFTAAPGCELTFRVEPAKEIAGIVKLADGTPLPKMSVCLRREHDDRDENFWATSSGDDGRFRVTGLPSGTYELSSTTGSGSAISVRYTKLTGVPSGRTDVEVVVQKAEEIAGRVLGPDGKPIAGVLIGTQSETGDRYTPSGRSAEDGTFVIRGLGTGTYRLDARPPETSSYGASLRAGGAVLAARITGVAPGTRGLEIRMPAGAAIRGVVSSASGAPLAGTWVRADLLPGQELGPWIDGGNRRVGAQTDVEGRFVLTGLVPLRYRLIQVPDPSDARVLRPFRGGDDVMAGATDVRLVAGGVATIAGVVVDEGGRPVAEAGVGATPVGGGPGVFSNTLADGTFALDGVSDLVRYVVSAAKGQVLKGDVENVSPGATEVRVRIGPGLEATGRVLQHDGTPFAKGYLEFTLEGGDFRVGAETDADGRFTSKGLRAGVYRVVESLSVMRPGDPGPRSCGTIRAGDRDVELKLSK